jgi:hypothetical protein
MAVPDNENNRNTGNRMLVGKCLCGAVQYAVADAFIYAANCHCSNCRRITGSALKPFAGIERDRLGLTRGEDNLTIFGDETGHDAHCKTCGSLLYSWSATALSCTSPWEPSSTSRPSDRRSTSLSALRRSGSRSPTTCPNMKSMSPEVLNKNLAMWMPVRIRQAVHRSGSSAWLLIF